MTEKEYKPKEVAEICRVKVITVWDWIRTGKLKARKQQRNYRVSESALNEFFNDKKGK